MSDTSTSGEDEHLHVRIRPECGACGYRFTPRQRIITLVKAFNTYKSVDAGMLLDSNYCEQPHPDYMFCRFTPCKRCVAATEAATLHIDCFCLYSSIDPTQEMLENLWTAATWRRPWRHLWPLPELPERDVEYQMTLASQVGLSEICRLPPELVEMISVYAEPCLLWQYSAALSFYNSISSAQKHTPMVLPIDRISAWSRGHSHAPETREKMKDSLICLTIDRLGLKEIKRVSCLARPKGKADQLFVVERADRLRSTVVEFKLGLARIRLPPNLSGLHMWDTSSPPVLEDWLTGPPAPSPCRFATIDTRACQGLTFRITSGKTYSIYAHSHKRSSAVDASQDVAVYSKSRTVWIYVPIAPGDYVTAYGTRRSRSVAHSDTVCHILRMRYAGDLVIGPHSPYRFGLGEDFVFRTADGPRLVHEVPTEGPIRITGAYPRTDKANLSISPLRPLRESPIIRPLVESYFSPAPLEGVDHVQTFVDKDSQHCKGVILNYARGGQRAVGQCRVGIDRAVHCSNPHRLCFSLSSVPSSDGRYNLYRAFAEFGTEAEASHKHDDSHEWTCCTMQGFLHVWFDGEQTHFEVSSAYEMG